MRSHLALPILGARTGFAIYVLLMPFMSALAPTEWTPLPVIFLSLAAPLVLLARSGPTIQEAFWMDLGFLAAWIFGCVAMLQAPVSIGAKNLNYAAAVLVSYALMFYVVRAWVSLKCVDWSVIAKSAHICLTFLSVAIIVEFIMASFFGKFYADIIPFIHKDLNVSSLVVDELKRPRAFSAEPGFTALAFECLWPLTLVGGRKGQGRHMLYLVGFSLLASAAAVASLACSACLIWLVRGADWKVVLRAAFGVALLACLVYASDLGSEVFWSVIGRKFDVASAQADGGSDAFTLLERVNTYEVGFTLLTSYIFGVGWGTVAQAFSDGATLPGVGFLGGSGLLNLYLDVAVASGFVGGVSFIVFVWGRVVRLLGSRNDVAPFVCLSLAAVGLHHAVITELQFPFIWFALAISDKALRERGVLHE